MDIRIAFILFSLGLVVCAYLFLSRREGNYVNILFTYMLITVPSVFLLEIVYLSVFKAQGSVYAYLYCYATYGLSVLAMVVAYLATPNTWVPVLIDLPGVRIPGLAWMMLLAGVTLYLPIIAAYPDLLLSPREIYKLTRTGFGIQYFISTLLAYLALIIACFRPPRSRLSAAIFVALLGLLLYLHGSKGQIIYAFLIWLSYVVFVRGRSFKLGGLIGVGGVGTVVIALLFYITLPPTMKTNFIIGVASYSDYTRNATLVIDDSNLAPQMGRLTAEASLYTMVPRAMFPDKPRDFGSLWLAKRYFPEWFAENTGSPAFGIGVSYADFRQLAFVWEAFTHLVLGCVLKILVVRLRTRPDPGTFVLLLPMIDIGLIPAGSPVPFAVYYVIAHIINILFGSIRPAQQTAASRWRLPLPRALPIPRPNE